MGSIELWSAILKGSRCKMMMRKMSTDRHIAPAFIHINPMLSSLLLAPLHTGHAAVQDSTPEEEGAPFLLSS